MEHDAIETCKTLTEDMVKDIYRDMEAGRIKLGRWDLEKIKVNPADSIPVDVHNAVFRLENDIRPYCMLGWYNLAIKELDHFSTNVDENYPRGFSPELCQTLKSKLTTARRKLSLIPVNCDTDPLIPRKLERQLSEEFPGWRFEKGPSDIQDNSYPSCHFPYYLWGDYDGNGRKDYVLRFTVDDPWPVYHIVVCLDMDGRFLLKELLSSPDFDDPRGLQSAYPVSNKIPAYSYSHEADMFLPNGGFSLGWETYYYDTARADFSSFTNSD